ncbi:MAG: HAMP domain-containing sensor histidine kinase [Bacilli bacterium]|nr:HAMP domain-containing sensor histidine kinase [Bacilli bacterium]
MNLSIKKKMIFSNILMIFIPIISFLILFGISISIIDFERWDSIENIYESNTNTYSAQSHILKFKEILSHESNKNLEKYINKLENNLSNLDYHFILYNNDKIVYNNLTTTEQEKINSIVDKGTGNLYYENQKVSIVVVNFSIKDNSYSIIAHTDNNIRTNNGWFSFTKLSLISLIIILISILFIIIVATNLILSSWITKSILNPLELLKNGANQISRGNLNFEINYNKKDEFGEVCNDFNKMKNQLKLSEEARNKYEEYRKEIINGVSHDLRTPLTSIKGYVEGLQDGIANTEEKKKKYYSAIHTRAIDIENLINNLSSLSSIENEKFKYNFRTIKLGEYLKEKINNYKEELSQKNIKVNLNILYDDYTLLDEKEFGRVLDNLLENTYKYGDKNNSIVNITLDKNEEKLQLIFKDNGPGVNKSDLDNIFISFYRTDKARTNPANGSGLGLSIVKKIIEGHNGTIKAINNDGLEFIITLNIFKEEK